MIIDCHAHVFTHWIGACGHPTRDIHKRYLQRVVTRTVAPTFRIQCVRSEEHTSELQSLV